MVHVAVVVAVEEAQLPLAVSGIGGRVDIQHDLLPGGVRRAMSTEPLQAQPLQTADRFPGRGVLQARERRLRGPRPIRPVHHRAQGRVVAQEGGIVGVLVAGRDLVDALAQKIKRRMLDVARVALVAQQPLESGRQPQALVELAQQDQSGLAGDRASLKVEHQPGLESEAKLGMTLRSRRPPPPSADAAFDTASIAQFGRVGGSFISNFMNNPG